MTVSVMGGRSEEEGQREEDDVAARFGDEVDGGAKRMSPAMMDVRTTVRRSDPAAR